MDIKFQLSTEQVEWLSMAISAWRSDYEGADDVPWDRVIELQQYLDTLVDLAEEEIK
jgi:hypothetical protein